MGRRVKSVVLPALVSERREEIGGTAAYVIELEKRLRDRGLEVQVLGYGPQTAGDEFRSILSGTRPRGRDLTWALWRRRSRWDFSADTVIHVQRPDHVIPFAGGPWPVVASVHGCHRGAVSMRQGAVAGWVYQLVVRRSLRRADALLFETRLDMEAMVGGDPLRRERSRLVPLGIDRQFFRPGDQAEARRKLGLPVGVPAAGYLGRLEKEKNAISLIRAMEEVSGAELWVAGKGSREEEWKREAGNRVRFLGFLPAEDVPVFLQACDVLTLASFQEGLATVVLQAWATGRPVILPPVGDFPELVGEDGGMVAGDNRPGSLARCLREFFAKMPETEEGQASHAQALRRKSERFDWEVIVDEVIEVYERAAERRASLRS